MLSTIAKAASILVGALSLAFAGATLFLLASLAVFVA